VAVLFINVNPILDHLFKYYFHKKVIVTLYVYNQYSEITNTVMFKLNVSFSTMNIHGRLVDLH
jgi:hypothetical protein